jgi:Transglycosylase SLT domain
MRLGTYLGIFGTLFGNALVAVVLFMITTGAAYHPPAVLPATVQSSVPIDSSKGKAGDTQPLNESGGDAQILASDTEQDCAVSNKFPEKVLQWCGMITQYANKRGLEPDLVAAVILQESGGNPGAYSSSGAVGLMQIMPRDGLAAGFSCPNGPCFSNRPSSAELQDPEYNIAYGTKLLSSLEQKYGSVREALKAYGPMDMGYGYADIVLAHFNRYGN